jgi:hypothetical protein
MPTPEPPLKVFTREAANRLLPGIRARLAELRAAHKAILALQGKVDIEEMTGGPAARMAELNTDLVRSMEGFEEQLEEFHALGCELKDLDRGLVDFYTMRGGELSFLCWEEGEDEIQFWHPLEGGYGAREPLER